MVGVDYDIDFPWIVQPQIKSAYDDLQKNYAHISVIANSIGAYFTMHSLQNCKIEKALFISPILDMEQLICDMMQWVGVNVAELQEKGEIPTDFGETLSWEYLSFVRNHPISWTIPTQILYATKDNLTSRETVDSFVKCHDAKLTVMKDGEHWFHTQEQIDFLDEWMEESIL